MNEKPRASADCLFIDGVQISSTQGKYCRVTLTTLLEIYAKKNFVAKVKKELGSFQIIAVQGLLPED